MANSMSVDKLAAEVSSIMAKYKGVIQENLKEAVDYVTNEAKKDLRKTSPKDTGTYAKHWDRTSNLVRGRNGYARAVYVRAPHYRLTHLLEYGHAKRGGGRTAPQPHIAPAEERAIESFEKRLKEGIEKA